jgi:acyl-CoA thioester hydrolase
MRDDFSFFHSTPVQIRFNDVDVMGHVNNSVYQHLFDYARLQYFEEVFGYRMDWRQDTLVLVRIEIDFISPVMMYDGVWILSKVFHLGNKSLSMEQRLIGEKRDDIRCKSKSVLSAFNTQKGTSTPLLAQWKNKIAAYEQDLKFEG